MRTSSDGSAQKWAPNGWSGVTVSRSSSFAVSGSCAMSPRLSLTEVPSFAR